MQRSLIFVAVLTAISSTAFAEPQSVTADGTDLVLGSGQYQSFGVLNGGNLTIDAAGGTVSVNQQDTTSAFGSKYPAAIGMAGSADKTSALSVKAESLVFNSMNKGGNSAWLNGYTDLQIDVGSLILHPKSNGKNYGFQTKNSHNTLTVFADEFTAYVVDGVINAQGSDTNIVNFGSADRRITKFEAHTTNGKDDYGVAILQANEGATINLFAEDALLDGPTRNVGGVLGSGGWGTINVDVSNRLTIEGNICGSYGAMSGGVHANTVFFLDLNANILDMTGDVNSGSIGIKYSTGDRTAVLNLNVGEGSVITGNLNAYEHGNIAVTGALAIKGDINVQDDGYVLLGGRIETNDTENGQNPIQKTETYGGTVTIEEGSINIYEAGSVTVGGILNARDSVVTILSDAPAVFANEVASPSSFRLAKHAFAHVKSIQADTADVTMEDMSTLSVEAPSSVGNLTGSNATLHLQGAATAAIGELTATGTTTFVFDGEKNTTSIGTVANPGEQIVAKGSALFNESFDSVEDAAQAALGMVKSGDKTVTDKIVVEESESNSGFEAELKEDGTIDESTVVITGNSKTERIGMTIAQNVLAWRLETNDLSKRMGELRDTNGHAGLWARINAGEQKFAGHENDFTTLQVGADVRVPSLWGAHVGTAFSYTASDLSYEGGDGDNSIYGLAAYATWLGETGSFLDVIAKAARLESDSTIEGTSADFTTSAFSLSAEIGHRFAVTNAAFVEPQFELSYGHVAGETFDTVNRRNRLATETELDATDSLVGRMGLRAGITCPEAKGNLYVHASVLREFLGDVMVSRGDGAFKLETDDTWFEYGIGGNYNVTPTTQVYADLERNTGADLSEPWRFNIGARWAF